MKKHISLINFFMMIPLALALSACANLSEKPSYMTVTGTISLEDESLSRAAMPEITNSATYFISASDGTTNVNGSIAQNKTFALTLSYGKAWTVTAGLKDSDNNILLSDTWEIPETNTQEQLSHHFLLKTLTQRNGNILLTLKVKAELDGLVSEVSVNCLSANSSDWEPSIAPAALSFAGEDIEVTLSQESIPSGAYEVNFVFYKDGLPVYNSLQTINVFENLTTNTWLSGGGTGPITDDGSFVLTKALVQAYSTTHIYVGATSMSSTPSDTTGTGSAAKPFESISRAVTYIETIGSTDKDYTIIISGTLVDGQTLPSSLDGKAKSITLQGLTGNTTDILQGVNDDGSGNITTYVLLVGTTVPVTIKNLKICNGCTGIAPEYDDNNDSYIPVDLTLGDGCLITNNGGSSGLLVYAGSVTLDGGSIVDNTGDCGGGVSISGGEFIMKSGSIGGVNETDANRAAHCGAGVYISGGTFTMQGGTICGNINNYGGGLEGAGVYVTAESGAETAGTFIMEGGTISGNIAYNDGGGVYVTYGATFIMTDGSISRNSSERTEGKGSGVYINSYEGSFGTFKMGGSAFIDGNNDVYLPNGAKITITKIFDGDYNKSNPAATITPETYESVTVLEAENNINLDTEYEVFAVSPQVIDDVSIAWKLLSGGDIDLAVHTGDLLLSDGTIIPYDKNRTSFDSELTGEAKPVGIVYALDNNNAPRGVLGIKFSSENVLWALQNTAGYTNELTDIKIEQTASKPTSGEYIEYYFANDKRYLKGDFDGSNNWQVVYNAAKNANETENAIKTNYPAFHYANTYGESEEFTDNYADGWYMPSFAELYYIYKNRELINGVLNDINSTDSYAAETIPDAVWSSSSSSTDLTTNGSLIFYFSGTDFYSGVSPRNSYSKACAVHKFN